MLKNYMVQSVRCFCTKMSSNLENYVQNGKKIVGVAANYKELLKQLNRPIPKAPGLFLKPTTSYIVEPQKFVIPKDFKVNEEIELGIVIGKKGKNISKSQAMDYVGGYCIALDMTATCQMEVARSTGGSWDVGKGFDTACPVSKFLPKESIPDPHKVQLWCKVNGKQIQYGNTNDLAFDIPTLIEHISKFFTLEPNDIIITGSPPGMGPVYKGDVIEGGIEGLPSSNIRVSTFKDCTLCLSNYIPTLIEHISKFFTLEPNDIIITGSPPGMGPIYNGDVIEGGIEGLPSTNIRVSIFKDCTLCLSNYIPTLMEHISKFFTLEPNDIIITGSPPGMDPVYKGDVIEGGIEGLPSSNIRFEVDAE